MGSRLSEWLAGTTIASAPERNRRFDPPASVETGDVASRSVGTFADASGRQQAIGDEGSNSLAQGARRQDADLLKNLYTFRIGGCSQPQSRQMGGTLRLPEEHIQELHPADYDQVC